MLALLMCVTTAMPTEPDIDQPPQDLHAEQATLGAMLVEPGAVDRVVQTSIGAPDFYRSVHGIVFEAIIAEHNDGKPVDIVTISARLRRDGKLDGIGGLVYLQVLTREAPTAAHAARYAEIVLDKARLRQAITLSADLREQAYRSGAEGTDVLASHQERLDGMVTARRQYAPGEGIDSLVRWAGPLLTAQIEHPEPVRGARFGIGPVDRTTGGLRPPCYAVLLAETGTGKTALQCQLLLESARHGMRGAYIALEGGRQAIMRRLAQQVSGVDMFRATTNDARTKAERDADVAEVTKAFAHLDGLPIHIEDPKNLPFGELVALIRQLRREQKSELVIIDYFQKLRRPRGADAWSALTEMSNELQSLTHSLGIAMVSASQVSVTENGEWYTRGGKDIKHDNDMHMVLLKYLPEDAPANLDAREKSRALQSSPRARISNTKAREGITGYSDLYWSDEWQRVFTYIEAGKHVDLALDDKAQFTADEWQQLMAGKAARDDAPPAEGV